MKILFLENGNCKQNGTRHWRAFRNYIWSIERQSKKEKRRLASTRMKSWWKYPIWGMMRNTSNPSTVRTSSSPTANSMQKGSSSSIRSGSRHISTSKKTFNFQLCMGLMKKNKRELQEKEYWPATWWSGRSKKICTMRRTWISWGGIWPSSILEIWSQKRWRFNHISSSLTKFINL